jgi:methyl-accepting chemotaxis protein
LSDVPSATVVQDGKLGGDAPKTTGPRTPYKRKMSNYLLDKGLQLRYVLFVTILSSIIAGALGYLIYHQSATASDSLARAMDDPLFADVKRAAIAELHSEDRVLVYKMIGLGIGLIVVLSAYLVIMTHKVAGPLYKVSMYFDRMAEGKLGKTSALRKGDMLQDFFGNFREMHEAVRTRIQSDVITMEGAANSLRAKAASDPKLAQALDALDRHVTQRKKQLL